MKAMLRVGWRGALPVALALTAFAAVPAQAAPPRTIAGFGSGAGKVSNPIGVAVDQSTGDLYVADRNNFRIDKFDSEGNFLLAWGWGVADGKSQELQVCGPAAEPPSKRCFEAVREGSASASGPGAVVPEAVAVEPSTGDVYVADGHNSRVSKFTSSGAFLYMVGGEVDKTEKKNICTAADLEAGDVCGAGLQGTGPEEFTFPSSLAFDPEGNLRVGDRKRVQRLDPDGDFLPPPIEPEGLERISDLAVDASGDLYAVEGKLANAAGEEGVHKYDPSGAELEEVDVVPHGPGASYYKAIALDAAGDLYVAERPAFEAPATIRKLDPSGELVSQFGTGQVAGDIGPRGIALDEGSEGRPPTLYAVNEEIVQAFAIPEPGPLPDNERAEEIEPTSATLGATLNPEGDETEYHFEYDTTPYEGETGHGTEVPIPEASLPAGFEDVPVQAELEGLVPDTTYHFRLCATNEVAEGVCGPDTTFRTRTAVGIEAQWATDIAARSATLHAELDPLGVVAHWKLEYGTSAGYGSTSAEFELPATFGAIPVAIALTGLSPATTYHYRFVASDKRESTPYTTYGSDRTFTTQLAGLGFALPDDRAWEMVSPPEKYGGRIATFEGTQGGQVQAAADGEALAYLSYGSLEENPEGNRLIEQSSELAKRGPGGAWSTRDITPPHTTVTNFGSGSGLEYKLFSADLERSLLEPRDCTALSPATSERTPYVRENGEPPAYTPLVTSKEGFADVPEGTPAFGGDCAKLEGPVSVRGAAPDLRHVVLSASGVSLAAGAASGSLYEWEAGSMLEPLSVLPGEEDAVGAALGSGGASVRGAISTDGTRVFWTSFGGGLYLRDSGRGETLRLDEEQEGAFGTGEAKPLFQGASADGSVAFFTDTQNLTEDANEEGADLYRWRAQGSGDCEEAGGCLDDLSSGVVNFGESAAALGLLPGFDAEGGASAYFVARGVLATNEGAALDPATGEPEEASAGRPNLYAWREGEGVRFVATLAGEDNKDWGTSTSSAYKLTAAASPSGRYLAFMSELPLSGYDNRDASSGERAQEVFRYDAQEDELTCVSCNPSGARPRAGVPGPGAGQLTEEFDPEQLWGGKAVAAVVPEASRTAVEGEHSTSLYAPRYVHDDGRVFFNAADSLVAADSNGDGDVYQYESTGAGTCTPASGGAGTATVPGGCVSLISSGTAEGTAAFLDASQGASDVFFYTPARLSVSDEDGELDVYDARVDGIPATLSPSAECLGEACQPPAVPPQAQTPASAAFRGPGNPPRARHRACAKGRHGRARCAKKRHRHRRHLHGKRSH